MRPITIRPIQIAFAILMVFTTTVPAAHAAVLYDASQNTVPTLQGWSYFALGSANQSVPNGIYTLNTTPNNNTQAGFSRFDQTLDADAGYTLQFDLRIDSENHATNHRAGISVIVVSSETDQAIELAFWENEIWAHEDDDDPDVIFDASHAEGTDPNTTDTTAAVVRYDLAVQGLGYELFANGNLILAGPLRDYTAWVKPIIFPIDPYETKNFIFFGDDTMSAQGIAEITRIELNPIPEPASGVAWLIGAASVVYMRRHRRII